MRLLFLASLTAAAAILPPALSVPPEIDRLDQCIQNRFLDARAFGMRRILPMQYHGIRLFQPENEAERAVVGSLRAGGYEVALYLVGRQALQAAGPSVDPRRAVAQGPALITALPEGTLPGARALLDAGRRALIAFEKGDGYTLHENGWTIALRPLRASGESCVRCHAAAGSDVKIGDPLGAALYVYRRIE
ncbi:MAG TPA: hypothetical protein VL285_20485 [Bryobacteraceae bacterium]|nr:hypothetical protein [Bryobacteraceae bacterium]